MPRYASCYALCLPAALCLAVAGCGPSGPKPSDAQISAYLAASQPDYLRVSGVRSEFEGMSTLGARKLPEGSWRVHVRFTLQAQQDLLAPTPESRTRRADFERTVAAMEEFRVGRIAAVAQLGRELGLVAPGTTAPEPATAVAVATRQGQVVADRVDLLAEPDGKSWRFFQLGAQAADDTSIGAPLATLRAEGRSNIVVVAGSDEDRAFLAREKRFLDIVSHAPKP